MQQTCFLSFITSMLFLDRPSVAQISNQVLRRKNLKTQNCALEENYLSTKTAVVTIYAGREIGSGCFVSSDGMVITNYHVVQPVVEGEGDGTLSIRTGRGEPYLGQVIGTDQHYDLALIQLNTRKQFPTVRFASNAPTQLNQTVWAIGSPFGCPGVLTKGTLSAVRTNGDLQSNVVLQPGNSGGPLLNSKGEVIGINKAILQSASGKNSGISFATNIEVARIFIARHRHLAIARYFANHVRPFRKMPVRPVDRSTIDSLASTPINNLAG